MEDLKPEELERELQRIRNQLFYRERNEPTDYIAGLDSDIRLLLDTLTAEREAHRKELEHAFSKGESAAIDYFSKLMDGVTEATARPTNPYAIPNDPATHASA